MAHLSSNEKLVLCGLVHYPTATDAEIAEAMAQEAPRGETPVDEADQPAAESIDTDPGQEDPAAGSDSSTSAGALQRNFPGVTYTGWIPPDDQIAAGTSYLVIPLNGAVAYYNKAGDNLYQTTLTGFFGSLANPVRPFPARESLPTSTWWCTNSPIIRHALRPFTWTTAMFGVDNAAINGSVRTPIPPSRF